MHVLALGWNLAFTAMQQVIKEAVSRCIALTLIDGLISSNMARDEGGGRGGDVKELPIKTVFIHCCQF